ncbi:hypothetical protein HC028_18570 [Planosporangium flavigriseum]|uniref:DNA-binding protein n=1 Tax=Planosporangium flavigriseum TaxID=373681 RepID=A0A8J3LT53_9ACTN|nr:hypothetical protein [Planosporangium flavigriseum]NJC66493.1 hypothetical protein [Planosporangium flavigriseum]GIG76370.1 hypothetical protein Pfl04_47740 [Planosporangium flavigriseum]
MATMRRQQFSLVVDEPVDESAQTALRESCPDATIRSTPDRPGAVIAFRREAPTLTEAIVSAVRDLDAVGVRTAGVRDEDFVSIGAVAARVGRSPEAVRLWAVGRTGAGTFPAPVEVRLGTAYYRWSEIATWLRERMGIAVADPEPVLTAVNLALRLRALAPRVPRMDAIRALIAA